MLRFSKIAFLASACLALLPVAHAVTPAPDGGYPGNNTAEGTDALFTLTTGPIIRPSVHRAATTIPSATTTQQPGPTRSSPTLAGVATLPMASMPWQPTRLASPTPPRQDALAANTSGSVNTATGDVALSSNTIGSANTASGVNALFSNTNASKIRPMACRSLSNTTGTNNTASGANALLNNTTGSNNIARLRRRTHDRR